MTNGQPQQGWPFLWPDGPEHETTGLSSALPTIGAGWLRMTPSMAMGEQATASGGKESKGAGPEQ